MTKKVEGACSSRRTSSTLGVSPAPLTPWSNVRAISPDCRGPSLINGASGPGVLVGVGLAVGVAVGVDVGDGLGVRVGVAVALGVAVAGCVGVG